MIHLARASESSAIRSYPLPRGVLPGSPPLGPVKLASAPALDVLMPRLHVRDVNACKVAGNPMVTCTRVKPRGATIQARVIRARINLPESLSRGLLAMPCYISTARCEDLDTSTRNWSELLHHMEPPSNSDLFQDTWERQISLLPWVTTSKRGSLYLSER